MSGQGKNKCLNKVIENKCFEGFENDKRCLKNNWVFKENNWVKKNTTQIKAHLSLWQILIVKCKFSHGSQLLLIIPELTKCNQIDKNLKLNKNRIFLEDVSIEL